MRERSLSRAAFPLAAASLLLLAGLAPLASALDVSPKAIKVVASHEYQDSNVESYAGELAETSKLDGRGGAIAVLDTGVDDEHPTFKDAFVAGARYDSSCNCMRDKTLGGDPMNPDDTDGHGTHVASTALGRGGSGIGPRGVAPGAALVDVQISNELDFSTSGLAKGIQWVMDYNDGKTNWTANTEVRVIVLSFGNLDPKEERTYNPAMEKVREATENGILVVPAAGNCGPDSSNVSQGCSEGGAEEDRIPSPGATPEALTVGAVDHNDTVRRTQHEVAGYSSRGPNPADNASDERWRKPDVVAPGTDITAACHRTTGDAEGMDCTKTGTSMAAPHVAGLATIVWQALDRVAGEDVTPRMVKDMITETATDMGPEGWDKASGYGYVDGYEAVVEATNEPPTSSFETVPADPEAGEDVTLDASDSFDPDERDRIDRYVWTIDGETEEVPGDQHQLHRVFDETGNHEIQLVTVDTRGAESEPQVRTIHVSEPQADEDEEGQPPTIDLAYGPTPIHAGEQMWFDLANSTDPDGDELVAFAWDFQANDTFDPDKESEQPRTTWTFDEAGEHRIEVQVTDATGANASDTLVLQVEEPPADPPSVAITNPQEGDVVEPGTFNVTWLSTDGPVDTFGVSVDEVAIDDTTDRFLEIPLEEEDRTIAVKANGPGGEAIDRVNVSVVEDESLEQSSADGDANGSGEGDANPPRHTASPDENDTDEDPIPAERSGDADEPDPAESSDPADENETPAPLAGAFLAIAVSALAAGRRRSR